MNRFEAIEKMFEKLGVNIDGREVWQLIEDNINRNGKMDGFHSLELGKFGDDRDLYFAGVDIKMDYSEDDDTYFTDISVLSISNSKKVVYVEDVEI